jgi:hypothetical protein
MNPVKPISFDQAERIGGMKPCQTLWILGGGRFGLLAARALRRQRPQDALVVVEIDPRICRGLAGESFDVVAGDAVQYLVDHLEGPDAPDWLVPVVPVHLAYEWVRRRLDGLARLEPILVPEAVDAVMTRVLRAADGTVYVSNAAFTCPDDCPEPAALCTVTGKPRPCIMHARLAGLDLPEFTIVVVRSRQLLPGVGGYRPAALFTALKAVQHANRPVLLASACCCHGVVNAFVCRSW